MNDLDVAKAIILGVVQGLTEFLPVSSSAHLTIAQRFLGLNPESPPMLIFDTLSHVGTLVAVGIVFFHPMKRFLVRLWRETVGPKPATNFAQRLCMLVMVSLIPTAAIGLGFQETFEAAFGKPHLIAMGLFTTGALLLLTMTRKHPNRGWKQFSWWHAAIVGLAQGGAIMPGISRSGATICAATFCGLRRRWSAEFSFLIASPTILGAALIKVSECFDWNSEQLSAIAWGPVLVGTFTSFAVGIVALLILIQVVRRAKLHYFSFYCIVVGALLILR